MKTYNLKGEITLYFNKKVVEGSEDEVVQSILKTIDSRLKDLDYIAAGYSYDLKFDKAEE